MALIQLTLKSTDTGKHLEFLLAKTSIAQTMNSLHKIFEPIVLGVLPGSIGIGAGVMMDYSTPSSASISTATSERSDKYLCPCP